MISQKHAIPANIMQMQRIIVAMTLIWNSNFNVVYNFFNFLNFFIATISIPNVIINAVPAIIARTTVNESYESRLKQVGESVDMLKVLKTHKLNQLCLPLYLQNHLT